MFLTNWKGTQNHQSDKDSEQSNVSLFPATCTGPATGVRRKNNLECFDAAGDATNSLAMALEGVLLALALKSVKARKRHKPEVPRR